MYRTINAHATVRQLWATELERRQQIETGKADAMLAAKLDALQQVLEHLDPAANLVEDTPVIAAPGTAARVQTRVAIARLKTLNGQLLEVPDGFTVSRKLERPRDRRRHAFDQIDERSIDWAAAEETGCRSRLPAHGISPT